MLASSTSNGFKNCARLSIRSLSSCFVDLCGSDLTLKFPPVDDRLQCDLPKEDAKEVFEFFKRPIPLSPTSFHLLPGKFYFLSPLSDDGSALGGRWIARMCELTMDKRHIFNPFNIHNYFLALPTIDGSINLSDIHPPLHLASVYSLVKNFKTGDDCTAVSKKVVGGWDFKSPYLFAVLYQMEREKGLFLWKLDDQNLIKVQGSNDDFRIVDIVSYKGKFFAFELETWKIGVINPSEVKPPSATMEFLPAPDIRGEEIDGCISVSFNGTSYILESVNFVSASNGCLYLAFGLICLPKKKKRTMLVFVMKEDEGKIWWENVKTLDDQIFFIGYDAAFSLPSASVNLPQWKPNSICSFIKPFPLIFDYCRDVYGMKVAEGDKWRKPVNFATYYRYMSMFTMGGEEEKKGLVPFQKLSLETYTGLFFPPPAWVKWHCPSLDNAEVKLHEIKFTDPRKVFGDYSSDDDDSAANDE